MTGAPALSDPADPPEKATQAPKIVLSVVMAGIVGLIVYAVVNGNGGTVAAQRGDCVKIVSAADAKVESVDCGSQDAVYEVAKRFDSATGSCPDGEYSELTSGNSVKLCLMLNAKEGDCFVTETIGRNRTHKRVPCGPSAEYRVVKVVPGKMDSKECAGGNVVASYAEPPTTICLT